MERLLQILIWTFAVFSLTGCGGLVDDFLENSRQPVQEDDDEKGDDEDALPSVSEIQATSGAKRAVGSSSSIEMRTQYGNWQVKGSSHGMKLSISKQGRVVQQ